MTANEHIEQKKLELMKIWVSVHTGGENGWDRIAKAVILRELLAEKKGMESVMYSSFKERNADKVKQLTAEIVEIEKL